MLILYNNTKQKVNYKIKKKLFKINKNIEV